MFNRGKRWLRQKLGETKSALSARLSARFAHRTGRTLGERFLHIISGVAAWTSENKRQLIISLTAVVAATTISSAVSLAHQQYIQAHTNEVFHIYVGDEKAGTVSDPKVVQDFLEKKQEEMNQEHPDVHMVLTTEAITYESEIGYKLTSEDGATLKRLSEWLEAKAIGVDLWVDDKFIGIVKDQETVDEILAYMESKYVPSPPGDVGVLSHDESANIPTNYKTRVQSVEFVEEVRTHAVVTDPDRILDPDEVIAKLENRNAKPTTYIVQEGDCVSCIAEKFSISKQVIYENNPWIKDDFIRVGDELDLTVPQPTLSVKTVEELRKVEKIRHPTQYIQDDTLRQGKTELVQAGKDGLKVVTFHQTKINGHLVEEELVDEEIIEEPVPAIVKRGTRIVPGEGTGSFRWPVQNPRITSSFGMRWGSMHNGIDIVSKNRNIMAADNGVVEFAGFNRGYGNFILINHQNGYHTLYAHLSEIKTKKGATVEKGEVIGVMGSTGNSTGVHLHFEIHKNGKPQNPSNYLNR